MEKEKIKIAVENAKRFIKLAQYLEDAIGEPYVNAGYTFFKSAPKESGSLRRASMDLTRSLAEMRKP